MSTSEPVSNVSTDPWVSRLKGPVGQRDKALDELRDILIRGLTKSMATRYHGALSPEDVVQDALLKILDSLDQFAGRSAFTTWAMTVATRISISQMRRKHYRDVSLDLPGGDDSSTQLEVADTGNAEAGVGLDRRWMLQHLEQLIDQSLTEKQRTAIRASLDGMPIEVIAEKTGSNRNSVYKLVHDARLKLRLGMEAAGVSADDLTNTVV